MAMPNCCLVSHLSPLSLHKAMAMSSHLNQPWGKKLLANQYKLYNHRRPSTSKTSLCEMWGAFWLWQMPYRNLRDLCVMWSNGLLHQLLYSSPKYISPQKSVHIHCILSSFVFSRVSSRVSGHSAGHPLLPGWKESTIWTAEICGEQNCLPHTINARSAPYQL